MEVAIVMFILNHLPYFPLCSDVGFVSSAKQDGGEPHLSVTEVRHMMLYNLPSHWWHTSYMGHTQFSPPPAPQEAGRLEIRALNFKQLNQVLKTAADKKLKEVQLCLEGEVECIPPVRVLEVVEPIY